MFVDIFTIYFRRIILTTHEIVQLASNILKKFNTHIKRLEISPLTVSTVCNKGETRGYTLLQQLDATSIATNSPDILHQSDMLLVKSYCSGVEEEGKLKFGRVFVIIFSSL